MPRTRRVAAWAIAASAAMAATMALHSPATAAQGGQGNQSVQGSHGDQPGPTKHTDGDIRSVGPNLNDGKKQPLDKSSISPQMHSLATKAAPANAQVGDDKYWLAEDDTTGEIYLKTYTLRGIGQHIQVWVADDRAFPEGDCRNDLGLTDVTDAQVNTFVKEFDNNIYPKESATFSVPPDRNGANATLPGLAGLPDNYYKVGAGQADDIAVLVDNVKDANYDDPSTPDGQTYIAGFFYSVFNEYVDRNVMTIDVYDWLHRTGANPPDDTGNQAYIDCANSQGQSRPYGSPRPHLYEGTFAHEYQHLLEYYQDPDEVSWVNEGLSDWAQTLVGYVNPNLAPDSTQADSHLSCFMGYQPPSFGGPENSLTLWGDQGGPEILCDYGAAYSFMSYLHGKYGDGFMSALHKNAGNGLEGLDAVFQQMGIDETAQDTLHKWAATMALDDTLDHRGTTLKGGKLKDYISNELDGKINWNNTQAFDSPGAPPNGSDYVRLRKSRNGINWFNAADLHDITFKGHKTLAPTPVEWQAAATPPDSTDGVSCGTTPAGTGAAALYSGCGDNLDRSLVRQVSVPSDGATLSFDALWQTEDEWDYGFVQVSDDGGKTWHSLATEDTTSDHDPGAISAVVDNLPGFTGDSGTWKTEIADLSAYAGKDVLLGFRYITDPGTTFAGFWVRNVKVGDSTLPSDSVDGWQTISEVNPTPVAGFTVQLIAYGGGKAWITQMPLNGNFNGELYGSDLKKALGTTADTVAAIVTYDDPSETANQYARYKLTVNGVTQPGG